MAAELEVGKLKVGNTHGEVTLNNTSGTSGSTVLSQTYNGGVAELRIGSNISTTSNSAMNVITGDAGDVRFNGKVSIAGNASADANADDLVIGDSSGGRGLTIQSGTTSGGNIYFADGTGANHYQGSIIYNHSSDSMQFATMRTGQVTISHTGLATFNNGITVSGGFTTLGSFSEVTISGGGVAVTSSTHRVDTEGDASSDDLYGITGGTDGSILILQIVHTDREVTVKHSNGTTGQNIRLDGGADFALDHTTDVLTLVKHGSFWCEVSRSNN